MTLLQIDPGAANFISQYGVGGAAFMLLIYLVYRMQAMIERSVASSEATITRLTDVLSKSTDVLNENHKVLKDISTIFDKIYGHASRKFDL